MSIDAEFVSIYEGKAIGHLGIKVASDDPQQKMF